MKKKLFYGILCCLSIAMQAQTKELWGVTYMGGNNNTGVLFKYDPSSGTYTKKRDFTEGDDRYPLGSLMQASNGKLYGLTQRGGSGGDYGVLFEYDPATSTYTKKLDFTGIDTGSYPNGSLMQVSNGKLYGLTQRGGSGGDYGVLFEYDLSTSTYTKKFDFTGTDTGGYPLGSLMQASNGKLYGMTQQGGSGGVGVLFEYDPSTSTYTKQLDFTGTANGALPYSSSLIQASNGKLYGMTYEGGSNNTGVLFEYDTSTSTYTKQLDFTGTNGSNPLGGLIQASNGKLYGMTYKGGSSNYGVLFEYDPSTSTYTKKLDFTGTDNGRGPFGCLMQASNGKLYGMTRVGGSNNTGVLFEYDPSTSTYTKQLDFTGTNGSNPYYTQLIEVTSEGTLAAQDISKKQISLYPNPVKDVLNFSEEASSVKITDISGRVVKQVSITGKSVNVADLAKGVYIITATAKDGKSINQKMIKE